MIVVPYYTGIKETRQFTKSFPDSDEIKLTFYEKLSDKKSGKNVVMTLISRTQFKTRCSILVKSDISGETRRSNLGSVCLTK